MPISRVLAAKLGIEPAFIRGHEDKGLVYLTWADCPVVGAQCASCNAILWVDQRSNAILNEAKPASVSESGPGYRAYVEERVRRFLASMPACPDCDQRYFDRFVNNVRYPRFSGGEELAGRASSLDLVYVGAGEVEVAVLE